MAQTLASGVVIPAPSDRISASGVQEMRTLGASVDTGLSAAQAQVAQVDAQSRARDAGLADQIAGMEGMTYVGAWESGRTYRINDVVTHGGDSWARLTAGSTGEPGVDPAAWGLVARKGDGGGFGELIETEVPGLYEPVADGIAYSWVGEPHASASIRRVNGVEVARNLSTNPSFETSVDGLRSRDDGVSIVKGASAGGAASGVVHSRLTFDGDYATAAHPYVWEDVYGIVPGQHLAIAMFARSNVTTTGFEAGIRLEFRNASGQVSIRNFPMRQLGTAEMSIGLDNVNRDAVTAVIPATAEFVRVGYRATLNGDPTALSGSGLVMFTDAISVRMVEGEAAAQAALSEPYFDGDTPGKSRMDLLEERLAALEAI